MIAASVPTSRAATRRPLQSSTVAAFLRLQSPKTVASQLNFSFRRRLRSGDRYPRCGTPLRLTSGGSTTRHAPRPAASSVSSSTTQIQRDRQGDLYEVVLAAKARGPGMTLAAENGWLAAPRRPGHRGTFTDVVAYDIDRGTYTVGRLPAPPAISREAC